MYGRSALILDTEDRRLARVSSSLIVLGHRPLYADDLDELASVAEEHRAQAGALLLPASHACEWWPALRKRIVEPLGLAPEAVLPVGEPLAAADAESLQCDGLRWMLREPASPWELRFAVSLVLFETDPHEARIELRVPCAIPVEVESATRTTRAELTDLSPGGAFVQLAHPHKEGTEVALRGSLLGRPFAVSARVCWRSGPSTPSWRDRGMGVVFEAIDGETLSLVRQQVECELDRFRIVAG
jgi:Tfp pilus assembly protein PilZ